MFKGLNDFSSQAYFTEAGNPLEISFDSVEFDLNDIKIKCYGLPLLKDEISKDYYFPDKSKMVIHSYVMDALEQNKTGVIITPKTNLTQKRYPYCVDLNFSYSSIDYEFIPGLVREWNVGFLTPIFFNIDVLNKYSQSPNYTLDLFSATYGNIHSKLDDWIISFGINKNQKVIMWLGDIDELPKKEQHYLFSENIDSDHTIHSEFYNAQIDVRWSDPSIEHRVFELRKQVSDNAAEKFGQPINKLEGEVASIISNLDKPVFWEDKHVSPVIESLNRVFIESLNVEFFKSELLKIKSKDDVKNLKGLKLYSLWLKESLKIENADGIMRPFFVLYDFRIMVCHLQSDKSKSEQLQSINQRLGIEQDSIDYERIYNILFENLEISLSTIISKMQ
ncbi:hypothetical protein HCO69_17155 [Pantoea sp. LS15]|uniref:hypothetical protein n=1 Tax=Enterobacterales TaxID=91347 RepID=UPI000E0F1C90|nr:MULTISPECIES: hypothetical protein [Enterobacterales]NJQ21355.1 hypothetical protein [Pantoea sp. LS15]NKF47951.1 hypothetical protein [Pantoea sp. LS15]RDK13488.1 hypothetical protein CEJ32_17550 [Enterobacter sp. 9-2]